MKHYSQQTNLDYLIPTDIIDYCRFDRFDFSLKFSGTPAAGRWPELQILVDGQPVATAQCDNTGFEFQYSEKLDMSLSHKVLEIKYVEKTNKDTVVDSQGNILENQSLSIKELLINGIDIIDNETMPLLGSYTMDLDPDKLAYYQQHGLSVEPTHSLDMYENGTWRLTLPIPITTSIAKLKNKDDPHEKWPDLNLLNDIVNTVKDIRILEQQLKERK